jgi:hypothetical protein
MDHAASEVLMELVSLILLFALPLQRASPLSQPSFLQAPAAGEPASLKVSEFPGQQKMAQQNYYLHRQSQTRF